jgi:hypothetical protein
MNDVARNRSRSRSRIVARLLAVSTFPMWACATAPARETEPPPARPTAPAPAPGAATQGAGPQGAQSQQRRGPRPYAQVITDRAVSDAGVFTVHKVEDRWFFELPDSLLGRDMLFISRIAGVPAGVGGFISAGSSVAERVVRWQRHEDRILARHVRFDAVADDSLPIALSVASNNVGPILAAFPVQAFGPDSATAVIDVTDFFAGDTPALGGLSPAQRRQYQVRRLDTTRSFVNAVRSYPLNIEVRHTQTFDAGAPPADEATATLSLEMSQSIVLLPLEPMRPRYEDPRAGFFSIARVNYGLDEQKAGEQRFIRRWRLEPKDPAAYARGESVEPVKPIVYYIDPATPAKWRPYVRQGIEDWQKAFETAGFRNAILAKDPPSPAEDPEWDPEDSRYSVVRWTASLVRNAVGPSTSDPRTGEIIESDITWYHNHMRSYRNRLLIETGAANPAARSLEIPEDLMGETMRQVIAHEVGHALGLPHNMIGSSSLPVDSLRSPSFTSVNGVSPSIMDYARQNYVAQPGDGLAPKDFIRRIGPYDHYIINWGYRVLPQARTAEDERPILDRWIREKAGDPRYRYLPQQLSGVDPRSQTEDVGDDPVQASGYAVENLKRVVPNLVEWTSRPGDDYSDLLELYGELLGQWAQYMGHVVTVIGGVMVDLKSTEQDGAVYTGVPKARQKRALEFIRRNVMDTPAWLAARSILDRIGPPAGATSVTNRQAAIVSQLFDVRRLGRLQELEAFDPAGAYPPAEYFADLKNAVFGPISGAARPDASRRALHRVHVERLQAIVSPPPAPAAPAGAGGGAPAQPSPLLAAPNLSRSDIAALARAQLREIRDQARQAAGAAPRGVLRAHWQDIADRIDRILDPGR